MSDNTNNPHPNRRNVFQRGLDKLGQEFEENPVLVIGVGAAFLTGAAKLLDAASQARSRRAYSKAVNYRIKKGLR